MSKPYKSLLIFGRQPELGLAELESLFGADRVRPFGGQAGLLDIDPDEVNFGRLGGSVRLARVLTRLPSTDWMNISRYLVDKAPEHAGFVNGKLTFGISAFGFKLPPHRIAKTALAVKKAIRTADHSVRMVPHESAELNAATVLYNKLTGPNGWELVVVTDGKTALLAQTAAIQDINAYAARDQARPYRDSRVGMLPPKLAQIIINLANPASGDTVLDPFCGTGVLLQEALLMGFLVYGTDIEPRMIEYSQKNLEWLIGRAKLRLEVADATKHKWSEPFDVIAAETFLGKPLKTLPLSDQLSKIIYEANLVNHKFLLNISSQLKPGARLCVAVPVWRGKHEFLHLPALDHLTDMGYTVVKFKHVPRGNLIYHREDQVVGRELLVLEKK